MKNIIDEIKKLKIGLVLTDIKMSNYTTYKTGGSVLAIVFPDTIENLIKIKKYLKKNNIKHIILGHCSNVIFPENYDGVVIKLDKLNEVKFTGNTVSAECGVSLINLSLKCIHNELSGLEFASGIHGSIGGSIYMNAGAYGSSIKDVLKSVTVLNENYEIIEMINEDLHFDYRYSILQENKNLIVLSATFELTKSNKREMLNLIKERKEKRMSTQPLEYPSAGSVFRNPKNLYAGALIEECGLKGKKVGGASISEKHANFIINENNATSEDIIKLINIVKNEVKKKFDIDLKLEQEIIK